MPARSLLRTPALAIALAGAVAASALIAAAPASAAAAAADTAEIAWTIETVDGPHGEGRPNFSYAVDPGTVLTDALLVTNTGRQPLDLAVYAADAYTTPTGNIDLDTPDLTPDDAGAWVSTDTDRLVLQPGEQSEISFTVRVPDGAAPGDHSAGLITSLLNTQQGTLSVDRRLATRISVRVSGDLVPAVDVSDVVAQYQDTWNPFAPGILVLDYRLTNTGNTRVTASETLTASAPAGLFATTAPVAALPEVIPGSTIEVHRELEIAPWGVISGTVSLSPEAVGLGAQQLDAVVLEFSTPAVPWAVLVVILVVAGLAVLTVLLVRRRRAASAAAA
jgi:hypothetical protein